MLEGQPSQVGVVHEVGRRAERLEEATQQRDMASSRLKEDRCRLTKPGFDYVEGVLGREGAGEERSVRAQPKERQQYDPCKAHCVRAVELGLEPASRRPMMRCVGVDGIEETLASTNSSVCPSCFPGGQPEGRLVVLGLTRQTQCFVPGDSRSETHARRGSAKR